jgi:hypothetical protein
MIADDLLSMELSDPSGSNAFARILILSYPPRAFFTFATLVQHIEQVMRGFWLDFSLLLAGKRIRLQNSAFARSREVKPCGNHFQLLPA